MKPLRILALAAFAAPVALAQTYYYPPRNDYPLAREELRRCIDRDEALTARHADLEAERRLNDREGQSIARANAMLAEDLRRLDPADTAAVAAHNARAAEHNRRVEAHNLRVGDQNEAARNLNRDQADMQATCGARTYYRSDRDAILVERGYLR
jgi:hypothetical protein